MKIQEVPYRIIPFSNQVATKRVDHCIAPNIVDSLVVEHHQEGNEGAVLRDLQKTVTDFLGEIAGYQSEYKTNADNSLIESVVNSDMRNASDADTASPLTQGKPVAEENDMGSIVLNPQKIPAPRGDVKVFILYGDGDLPQNPLRTLIAYEAENYSNKLGDRTGLSIPPSDGFLDRLVDNANKSISTLADTAGPRREAGYVVTFPHLPTCKIEEDSATIVNAQQRGSVGEMQALQATDCRWGFVQSGLDYDIKETANLTSKISNDPSSVAGQWDNLPDPVPISAKVLDKLLVQTLVGGGENDMGYFQRLHALISNMNMEASQDGSENMSVVFQNDRALAEEGKTETGLVGAKIIDPSRPLQAPAGQPAGKINHVVVSVEQNILSNANLLTAISVGRNGAASKSEPVLKETVIVAVLFPAGLSVKPESTMQSRKGLDSSNAYGTAEAIKDGSLSGKPDQEIATRNGLGREKAGITTSVISLDSNRIGLAGGLDETATMRGVVSHAPEAPLPMSDDRILVRIVRFVDDVNGLVNSAAGYNLASDENVSSDPSIPRQQSTEPTEAGVPFVIQGVAKKVFADCEEFKAAESIGLSQVKASLLRVDASLMRDQLSSRKEETLGVVKEFAAVISDRIAYSTNPYAGLYMYDKKILQLRATQKDEGASLPNEELNKQKDALEKRLKELQLLIEDSTRLVKWFSERAEMKKRSLEAPTLEAAFQEVLADT